MKEKKEESPQGKVPEASFISLIYFLMTIALQHLGVMKNPITDKVEKNLELAKYSIDSLGIVKEKTKGNLTKDEERFLESALTDLKLSYVKATKS